MSLATHFRKMARNNAWANHRLLAACAQLSDAEFTATRTSFFPSLKETLNHSLSVDLYYIDALEQGGGGQSIFDRFVPLAGPALLAAQSQSDRRLIAFCDVQDAISLAETVETDLPGVNLVDATVEVQVRNAAPPPLVVHQLKIFVGKSPKPFYPHRLCFMGRL